MNTNSTTKEMSTWLGVNDKKFQDLFKKLEDKDQKKLTSEFKKLKGGRTWWFSNSLA